MISSTGILGYCDPLMVTGGQPTKLKISSNGPKRCTVEIFRMICGDMDPNGPGQAFEPAAWHEPVDLDIKHQRINAGSHAIVDPAPGWPENGTLTLCLNIFPTQWDNGTQTLVAWGEYRLQIKDGILRVCAGEACAVGTVTLLPRRWYRVTTTLDPQEGLISVGARMLNAVGGAPAQQFAESRLLKWNAPGSGTPLLFAAEVDMIDDGRLFTKNSFNGKIEAPTISGGNRHEQIASWDFSIGISTDRISDTGSGGFHGTLINLPMRAASGSNWDSSVESWREDPSQYGAIHFHDDDMVDCVWDTSLEIRPPTGARSGYYIARLTADGVQSDVPFFVSAKAGKPQARVLFLAPTATYLSYANTHIKFDSHNTENLFEAATQLSEDELYLNIHRELGLSHYDTHSDDSGVVYASSRRPMLNTRPGLYTFNYLNDTHILKWLEDRGTSYDVATDEDLHRFGTDLLEPYDVVITGSHPEYYSTEMWDALNDYQNGGGRHMYLGGNGFYWRIAYSDLYPGVIENRRGVSGVRTWEGEPGEHHLAFSGEPGGLWRTHGRAPQALVGTGFSSTLFVKSTWFRRSEASFDPRYAFVFRGVNADTIGDFGFRGGGCVGLEIDRWDPDLGSPPNSVVLATSEYAGPGGLLSGEEFITTTRALDGVQNGRVRADMVYFTTAGGGAVWSTGSIAWATSLLWNGGDNSVSTVTGNVLDRFLDPEPLV